MNFLTISFIVVLLIHSILSNNIECHYEYRFSRACPVYDFNDSNCDYNNLKTCRIVGYRTDYRCPIEICQVSSLNYYQIDKF